MQVLMIGLDSSILRESADAPGDTRDRHIRYAAALKRREPEGQLTMVVRTPRGSGADPVLVSDGLVAHSVPCPRWAFTYAARRALAPIVEERRFDLVTTQTPFDDGLVGLWLKRKYGIPLNVQMRSSFIDVPNRINQRPIVYRVLNTIGKSVLRRADTVRVISDGEKARLAGKFPDIAENIHVLHPLVNTHIFTSPITVEESDRVRSELRRSGLEEAPYVLYVGRLMEEKNPALLLEALASARVRRPDLALVMAGDGRLRDGLKMRAGKLNQAGHVKWLGNVPLSDLRGWYANATATVLPSLQEGFGKVIVESYLMGTPVVTTPFVSAPELILDGETGFIADSFTDPTDLASKVVSLLASPKRAQEMGRKGRAHVTRYLIPENVYMHKLIEIWERTARKREGSTIGEGERTGR